MSLPTDNSRINDEIRRAAAALRKATQIYCEGYYRRAEDREIPADHPLVRALAALAEADRQTCADAGIRHDPAAFSEHVPMAAARRRASLLPPLPAYMTEGLERFAPMPPAPKDFPRLPTTAPDDGKPLPWPRDVTAPGPDQQPGTVPATMIPATTISAVRFTMLDDPDPQATKRWDNYIRRAQGLPERP
jgi:hypothetical protein